MGQAKQRGSREDRTAQALAKVEAIKPKVIVCNHCKIEIIDVLTMDARNMVGINGAFAGMCVCGHTTWAVAGDPNAVASLMESLEETTGGGAIIGSLPIKQN